MKSTCQAVQTPEIKTSLVSVVIVNYNGLKFLENCLTSLSTAFNKYQHEIIIVDNDSSDGSRQWLADRSGITYVESKVNLGFTGGNNLGVNHARGDRLLFINNDTQVVSKLDPMLDLLDQPDVGIGACRLQYGNQQQQFSFGYEHSPLRIVLSWLGLEKMHTLPNIFRRLETNPAAYLEDHAALNWVSGACFAMRTSDWKTLGGFDTAFFMYCEDVDLCARVRKMGMRIAFTPRSLVTHYEGAGKAWIGSLALMRTVNSYRVFAKKHYGLWPARWMAFFLAILFLSRAVVFKLLSLANGPNKDIRSMKASGFYKATGLLLGLPKQLVPKETTNE